MPPTDDGTGESLCSLVPRLRGRIGLTQRELAAQVGVHVHSVQGWEAGTNFPGAASLQALIVAGSWAERFTAGREAEEAALLLEDQGYGPGNLVNLLRPLRGDLKGVDLFGLAIRQIYLPDVEAQGASLAGAHLSETVLGEAFSYPTSLALSADGAYLVAGTARGEVCRWRVADRTLLAALTGHTGVIWGMALSGDGRLLASSGLDETVRRWEASSGASRLALRGKRRYEALDSRA